MAYTIKRRETMVAADMAKDPNTELTTVALHGLYDNYKRQDKAGAVCYNRTDRTFFIKDASSRLYNFDDVAIKEALIKEIKSAARPYSHMGVRDEEVKEDLSGIEIKVNSVGRIVDFSTPHRTSVVEEARKVRMKRYETLDNFGAF